MHLFLSLKLGLGTDQIPLYQISMHELINGAKVLCVFLIITLILVNFFTPGTFPIGTQGKIAFTSPHEKGVFQYQYQFKWKAALVGEIRGKDNMLHSNLIVTWIHRG